MFTQEDNLKQSISDLEFVSTHPGSVLLLLEKRREELENLEAEHQRMLKALQSARNYSMEANMGDYSMSSINRAQTMVQEAKQALIDAGYEIPAW